MKYKIHVSEFINKLCKYSFVGHSARLMGLNLLFSCVQITRRKLINMQGINEHCNVHNWPFVRREIIVKIHLVQVLFLSETFEQENNNRM